MQKIRTIVKEESYNCCDFCDNRAQYHKCFICGKDMCENHMKEFDVIDYDLVYICPECEKRDYTELKKLNDKYMRLCNVGEKVTRKIREEIDKLNGVPRKEEGY